MKRHARLAVAALLAGCFASCGRPDFSERFLRGEPGTSAVRGSYAFSEQTLVGSSAFEPSADSGIRLLADGRFEARGFPVWRPDDGRWQLGRKIDATGVWRVIPHGETWAVSLTSPIARIAVLGRHEDRIQLIFVYGDVDRDRVMVFTRR